MEGLSRAKTERLMLELVRTEIVAVLGFESSGYIEPDGDVLEMGMSSMSVVQLRETLATKTGLELPDSFIYDLYTPTAIAEFLVVKFLGEN
jgi:acyl carrier protein